MEESDKYIRFRKDGKFRVHFERDKIRYEKDFKLLSEARQWRDNTMLSIGDNPQIARKIPNFTIQDDELGKRFRIDYIVKGKRYRKQFSYSHLGVSKEEAMRQAHQFRADCIKTWSEAKGLC